MTTVHAPRLVSRRAVEGAIVERALGAGRRGTLGYGIGLALMIVWVMALHPSVEGELEAYVDAMPAAMAALFGLEEVTSLAGFVHAEVFSLMGPLVLCALAIAHGSSAIAGEERDGVLAILLATGVSRGTILLSRFVVLLVELVVVGAIVMGALVIGNELAGGGLAMVPAVAGTVQMGALGLLFGATALSVSAATGSRGTGAAVSAGAAIVSYLVDGLAQVVSWLEPFEAFSPFDWYAPGNPLIDGFSISGLLMLLTVTAVAIVVGIVAFDRRDVAV